MAQHPLIVFIGLSGAGKTTACRILETHFQCRQVRRYTTRRLRRDDDPQLLVSITSIEATAADLTYPGWKGDRYCVKASDIAEIRSGGKWPLLELGDPQDAQKASGLFAPVRIVRVCRDMNVNEMRRLLTERGMHREDVDARLESVAEDNNALSMVENSLVTLRNEAGVNDYTRELFRLAETLRITRRPADESQLVATSPG